MKSLRKLELHHNSNMRNFYINDYNDELINEMAMVGVAWDKHKVNKYAVSVDSSETRIGEPYFKFYAGRLRGKETPVARISFLEPRYIIHYKKSNNQFVLNAAQRHTLVNFMQSPNAVKIGRKKLTNWEYAILQYNLENIAMRDWDKEEWVWFTTRWKRMNRKEIAGESAEYALPIDLPMPDYLKLR